MGSTARHDPGLAGGLRTSEQFSFSPLPSDAATEGHLTPPTALLSTLLGFTSPKTHTEGVETLEISTPAEVVSVRPTSIAE